MSKTTEPSPPPGEPAVPLDEFIAELKANLDKFATNWRKENGKASDRWPMEMPFGEWYEQFLMFMDHDSSAD